ncbi:MAG: HNH endonuclease signature motif containing protein, partial [Candidatus Palauibacterales bacterium]|nr:HNH endonuclease signature motif containing protein [Candidatus Palauibacterales bacterium]
PDKIDRALDRIENDGRLLRDPDTDLLLIRRYLEYRPLDPGDRGRAARLADALPFSEPVLAALRRELTEHGGPPGRLAERVLADRLEGAGNEEFPWRRKRHVPEVFRERVRRRDGSRCVRCGSEEELTVDHVRPFSRGGLTVPRNLQLLCKSCNSSKSAHTMEEWAEGG